MNGIASSPASRIVSSRTAGTLSGEAQCGPPFNDSRSDTVSSMIPIDAETGRNSSSSSRLITPGLRCGSIPVSSRTRPAQCARYSIVVAKPSSASSVASDPIAQLGLVAEREQRLGAAGGGPGARDLEHLVDGAEGTLATAGGRANVQ